MTEITEVRRQLFAMFGERLHVDVPTADTELIESGLIDSLQLVELLAAMEETFGLTVAVEDLDLENFQTIDRLAAFVAERQAVGRSGG